MKKIKRKTKPVIISYDGLWDLLNVPKYECELVAYTDLSTKSSGMMTLEELSKSYVLLDGCYDNGNKPVYILK